MTEKDIKKDVSAHEEGDDSFIIDEDFFNSVKELIPTTDDVTLPSLTFRVWFLGTVFCLLLSIVNQIFTFRTNPFAVPSNVAVILAYPMGKFLARVLPSTTVLGMNLNPGPFSIKEHILIGIFGSTGSSSIYAFYNLGTQELFYNLQLGVFWDIAFLLSTACMGFGLAGLFRRFVIRPAHMIWPGVLPSVALFQAFHRAGEDGLTAEEAATAGSWSRLKMFFVVMVGAGIFHFFGPGYFSGMLSSIPLLCFVAPKSATTLHQLGSPQWGPGVMALSLDLTVVGTDAMAFPFWTTVNMFVNFVLLGWIISPLMHYNNFWNQPALPGVLNSPGLFDNNSKAFRGSVVMTKDASGQIILSEEAYKKRAPIHFTSMMSMTYFGHIAALAAAVVHTTLWYGKDISSRFRAAKHDKEDIHCKLMNKYPDISDTVYLGFLIACGVGLTCVAMFSNLGMPLWSVFFAMALAIVGAIPMVILRATTGAGLGLNVISQFLIGLVLPGQPIVMMGFKCICFAVSYQILDLLVDLKLGHYMKVNPRHVFIVQVYSQVLAAFAAYAGFRYWVSDPEHRYWVVEKGSDEITGDGVNWSGSNLHSYYNASLIWGAIGAKRFFFDTQYAAVIIGGLIIGTVTPILLWGMYKMFGGTFWQLIHPVILVGPISPGYNQAWALSGLVMGFVSQHYLYRHKRDWWTKYNYVVAVALTAGIAFPVLFVNFFPENWAAPDWFLNVTENRLPIHGTSNIADWCFPKAPKA